MAVKIKQLAKNEFSVRIPLEDNEILSEVDITLRISKKKVHLNGGENGRDPEVCRK